MPRNVITRAFKLVTCLLFAAAALTGCGGGGGSDSGAAPQSSFTTGPISGFGSVIVNGTRFDVSKASVIDDQGRRYREEDLKLGMVAEVQSGDIASDNTGQATEVRFGSAIIGPVDAINTSTRLLIVLGQTIDVSDTTVFGDTLPNGPFNIVAGDVLEIYGMLDATTGHYAATRIEAKPDAAFYKLRGKVSSLDAGAGTFMIGRESISFASLSRDRLPALSDNMEVIADLQLTQDRNGNWIADAIRSTTDRPAALATYSKVKLKGFVTSVDSQAYFSVDGIPVDASNAKVRPKKRSLFVGAYVKVEGAVSDGTIVAKKVHIKSRGGNREEEDDDDEEHEGFELHGAITQFDASSRTFMLRGVPVRYQGDLRGLRDGSKIEIKGSLSSDGRRVEAHSLKFED